MSIRFLHSGIMELYRVGDIMLLVNSVRILLLALRLWRHLRRPLFITLLISLQIKMGIRLLSMIMRVLLNMMVRLGVGDIECLDSCEIVVLLVAIVQFDLGPHFLVLTRFMWGADNLNDIHVRLAQQELPTAPEIMEHDNSEMETLPINQPPYRFLQQISVVRLSLDLL
jgi:hypothetical protein